MKNIHVKASDAKCFTQQRYYMEKFQKPKDKSHNQTDHHTSWHTENNGFIH